MFVKPHVYQMYQPVGCCLHRVFIGSSPDYKCLLDAAWALSLGRQKNSADQNAERGNTYGTQEAYHRHLSHPHALRTNPAWIGVVFEISISFKSIIIQAANDTFRYKRVISPPSSCRNTLLLWDNV
jgi:hypothetical protein